MRLDDVIRQRRSVRGLLHDEVPPQLLREVFELAQWTPSNCNVQPGLPQFFGAPHAVLVFMQQPFDTREATDIGMYAQGALGLYPPIARRVLNLPGDHRLLFGISFGYEDPATPANGARTRRAPLEAAVRFHT